MGLAEMTVDSLQNPIPWPRAGYLSRNRVHVSNGGIAAPRVVQNRKLREGLLSPSMKSSAMSTKKLDTLLPLGWKGCQGRPRAFISTLDSPSNPHTMERGTKRNEIQLSFVPWQKDFAFDFCRGPFARPGEYQTGGENRKT